MKSNNDNNDNEKRSSTWAGFFHEVTEHVVSDGIGHAIGGHLGGFVSGLFHTASVNKGENEWLAKRDAAEIAAAREADANTNVSATNKK